MHQTEVHQFLVVIFAQPLDEAVARQRYSHTVRREPVFGEAEVEEGRYGNRRRAELFLLLDEVGAPDEANGAFVTQNGEELEHLRSDGLVELRVKFCMRHRSYSRRAEGGALTRLAAVRVPSTSKRQMVFLTGLWSRGG